MSIKLEPLGPKNAWDVYEFEVENRAHFEKYLLSRGDNYYKPEIYESIARELIDEQNGGGCLMYIIRDEAGKVAGRVNFTPVEAKTAELGYRIGKDSGGRGVATRAVKMAMKLAEEHGLEKIMAGTSSDNVASQRVLEKNGFVFVGKTENYMEINGVWVDSLQYVKSFRS